MGCVGKTFRFQKFANASQTKFWASAMHRGRPEKMPKVTTRPAWKPSGARQLLRDVEKVAVDTQIRDLPATPCTIKTGCRRLMCPQNASLMVVASTARLHACGPFDCQHLCDLIYIIGLGLPAVLASTWRSAGGRPAKLEQAKGLFLHARAAKLKPCTFLLGSSLKEEHPELRFALQHCAQPADSKWTVLTDRGQPLAANFVRVGTLSQLAAAILKLTTLKADGCRGYEISGA
jgi:hypothetical protein